MTTLFPTLEPSVPSPLERARRRLERDQRRLDQCYANGLDAGIAPNPLILRIEHMIEMRTRHVANLERMAIRG